MTKYNTKRYTNDRISSKGVVVLMKAKKLLSLILSLLILLNFTSCGNSDNSTKTKETVAESTTKDIEKVDKNNTESTTAPDSDEDELSPLLYKVTDKDGNVIWLFGSIHVGEEDFYPLPDYVMNAYNSSDALAVEFDITIDDNYDDAFTDYLYDMVYLDGSKLPEHIPEDLYNQAKEILEENDCYFSELDYYKPGLWSEMIDELFFDQLDINRELGIDYFFLNTAHDEDKKIYNIESLELQMGMMAQYSEPLQILLLEISIESYYSTEKNQKLLDEMLEIWAQGDAKAIDALLNEEAEEFEDEKELYEEYNTIMMTDRNYNMTNFAEKTLTSGEEVFIVVGAAHVVGEDGIANQLKNRGYTVEVIK